MKGLNSWHASEVVDVLRAVEGSTAGLSREEARSRLSAAGLNTLPRKPRATSIKVLLKQFRSPLTYILCSAVLLAATLHAWRDAVVIVTVIFLNAFVGFYHERKAESAVAALENTVSLNARVIRDGNESLVASSELVTGDILLLSPGDAVTADARLIESVQLEAAEAMLTGESIPVAKDTASVPVMTRLADRTNMVFAGTYVTSGRGKGVVVATGGSTALGQVVHLTDEAKEPMTPLEKKVAFLGRVLMGTAACVFILVLLVGLIRGLRLADVLMVATSQMVSIVPEGLPIAITIAMAVGAQRMARKGVIIRRLSSVETLGSTTVICTDKTGTLTQNEMTVSNIWLPSGRSLTVDGSGYRPRGEFIEGGHELTQPDPELRVLLEAGILCNDSQLIAPSEPDKDWVLLGDPTEGALLTVGLKAGIRPEIIRKENPRVSEQPFDSATKTMRTSHAGIKGEARMIIKGAPESVLPLCKGRFPAFGKDAYLAVDEMSAKGLRVLAIASAGESMGASGLNSTLTNGNATLLGIVGQKDPPREDAKAAIARCQSAGIKLMMLTGDHPLAGLAIARGLGIATGRDCAIEGSQLDEMSDVDLEARLKDIAVFSRVEPVQKLRIVTALQRLGEVVAMTGDGVNDAPALAQADVGVAMGKSGTDVAKNAASIIITDDNFSTIVNAVEQGRIVYWNLRKVVLFLLVTSLDEIFVLLLAMLSGFHSPLAAVQILWINIVTETTLTANLVMEPRDGRELSRPPVPIQSPLVDAQMKRTITVLVPAAVLATLGWFVWRQDSGETSAAICTETFTLLAMCQWFNALNCQSETESVFRMGILGNLWLLGGLGLSVFLQALVVYTQPLNALFHAVPIPLGTLCALMGVASTVLWIEEVRKRLRRARAKPEPLCQ